MSLPSALKDPDPMTLDQLLGAIVTLALLVYLTYALLRAESF